MATLRSIDPDVAVKKIPLRFPDRDSIFYYLFLLTRDGTGALEMNRILDAAEIRQYDYRQQNRMGDVQLLLFDEDTHKKLDTYRPTPNDANIPELMEIIYSQFKGQVIDFRSILKYLADSPYYLDDAKKALGKLKKEERASFETPLSNKKVIRFR